MLTLHENCKSMTKKELYRLTIEYFEREMPEAATELQYGSPFQLLTAVILSAQCTDRRVNMVTPALFASFPTVSSMAAASETDILRLISSVSYPNSKARHLKGMAWMLEKDFGGEVPQTMEELTRLPGVGRKTANVVLSVVYGQAAMAVDTHVFRVSHRIGLVPPSCHTPLATERHLTRNLPEQLISRAHHWLILHGRYVCRAVNPKCTECGLNAWCRKRL